MVCNKKQKSLIIANSLAKSTQNQTFEQFLPSLSPEKKTLERKYNKKTTLSVLFNKTISIHKNKHIPFKKIHEEIFS